MRLIGPGLELRMRLRCEEPRMIHKLNHLDNMLIRRNAAQPHAALFQSIAVVVVYLIAMAMALKDKLPPIGGIGLSILLQYAWILPQAHRSAQVGYILLIQH